MRILLILVSLLIVQPLFASEFRGAWVASVFNINFPSKSGLSAAAQKQEIRNLVSTARATGINALLVQVRSECDALYQSDLEPWSRWLTGTQGRDPGYDPLAEFIAEGKRQGVEIHAWINPLRAAANASHPRASNHPANRLSRSVHRAGSFLLLDPGDPAVIEHTVRVVRDIASRYAVAGIHLDDYFYPYPSVGGKSVSFADDSTYAAYKSGGGSLAKADWRRENINTLVRRVGQAAKSARPGILYGVSPFGIYTKGQPSDVKAGVDQLNMLHADPLMWMKQGWVDYLAPQLYWPDGGDQSFSSLLRWWRSPSVNPRGVPIFPGIAVDRMTSHKWSSGEIARQLKLEATIGPRAGAGWVLWNMKAVMNDTKGVRAVVKSAK